MPDYDDGLVEAVAKAIALETMGWAPDDPVKLDSRIYIDEDAFIEPARIARAAIAAVLEWQGKQEPQSVQLVGTMFRDGDMEHLWILPNGEVVVTKDSDPPCAGL